MIKLIRLFNTLSFDTAFGAVSFVFIISYSQQVEINYFVYSALFISVLSIYNLDHLLDAIKLKDLPKSYRHTYYQNNRKALIIWQLLLFFIGLVILFYIPAKVFWAGVGLLLSIGIYFWVIFSFTETNWIFREVIVAIGYTVAVVFVPIINSGFSLNLNFFWIFSIIFLIALSNLWVFSIYDIEIDHNQKHHSIAKTLKVPYLRKLVRVVLLMAILVTLGYTYYYQAWVLGGTLFFTEFMYLLLLEKTVYFNKNEYYRLVGESVLVFPGMVLLSYNAI